MSTPKRVYLDGVFDMFHIGHLQSFRKCRALTEIPILVVGVVTDEDAESYKRRPIICHKQRVEIVRAIREVDEVIETPPLILDEQFMTTHRIDIVAHSFSNEVDYERQKKFFEAPIRLGKFARITYSDDVSTTNIIGTIAKQHTVGTVHPWTASLEWDCIVPESSDAELLNSNLKIGYEPATTADTTRIFDAYQNVLRARTTTHLGYPYNLKITPPPFISDFMNYSINNLGDPFVTSNYAIHSRYFETAVLDFFANMWKLPSRDDYWGYITACGTESNMCGLLLARERLPNAVLCASKESHYSIFKAAKMFRMNWCAIETQVSGEIDYDSLKTVLLKNADVGIILNLNIGTTVKGAVDRIGRVIDVVKCVGITRDRIHIHCDGALMGAVLSYIMPHGEDSLTFENPYIDSIAISGHKMLGSPMPCGVFMTRCHNVTKLANQIEYIGSVDSTIMGSRNGHTALFVWNALITKGIRGLEKEARLCIQNAKYMQDSLTKNGVSNVLLNNWSCTVVMPRPTAEFVKRWQLACTDDIAHVVIMPNVTPIKIDTFVSEYIEDRTLSGRYSNKETRAS